MNSGNGPPRHLNVEPRERAVSESVGRETLFWDKERQDDEEVGESRSEGVEAMSRTEIEDGRGKKSLPVFPTRNNANFLSRVPRPLRSDRS
jgi:hypothetical protein